MLRDLIPLLLEPVLPSSVLSEGRKQDDSTSAPLRDRIFNLMDYLNWNKLIAEHFFRPEMAGRRVYLYVTTDQIDEIGRSKGADFNNFIKAIKTGRVKGTDKNICQQALDSLDYSKYRDRQGIPQYIGYLALFVLVASKPEENFVSHSYYPDLRSLIGEKPSRGQYPKFDKMRELWDDLEQWSQKEKDGELGIFYSKSVGGNPHIGYPLSQTLLTEPEIKALPKIFYQADLDPICPLSEEAIAQSIVQHGNKFLRKRTVKFLTNQSTEQDFRQALIERIMDQLGNWDGTVEILSQGGQQHISGSLRLCCQIDTVAENAKITLRCSTKHEFPEDDLLLHFEDNPNRDFSCYEHDPNWSSVISDFNGKPFDASQVDWSQGLRMRSLDRKWYFSLPASPIRIFVTGTQLGLPGLVEVRQIKKGSPFYLAVHQDSCDKIEKWGQSGCQGFKKLRIVKGLPSGWHFYKIDTADHDDLVRHEYPILAFPTTVRLEFAGGIRVDKGNQFFEFAVPKVVLEGADDSVKVYCQDRLLNCDRQTRTYTIPADILTQTTKITIEARQGDNVVSQISFSLVKDFTWKNCRSQQFDREAAPMRYRFGVVQSNCQDTLPVFVEEMVNQDDLPEFKWEIYSFDFQSFGELFSRSQENKKILWIGREPGQVATSEDSWPDWFPVWAICMGEHYDEAHFCGANIATSYPISSSEHNQKKLKEWKKILWRDRKRILLIGRETEIRDLWEKYKKYAKQLKTKSEKNQKLASNLSPEELDAISQSKSDWLLYVVSAKKEISWLSFKKVFNEVYRLEADPNLNAEERDRSQKGIKIIRFETVRALDALGHCDFDFSDEGSRIYADPPVLVRLPLAGNPQAILAGARSPQTIKEISKACQSVGNHIHLEVTKQPGELSLVPHRIAIHTHKIAELEAIAQSTGIAFTETPAAWSLLHFSASLEDYLATLQWSEVPELSWKRETFAPIYCQFSPYQEKDGNIRLCKYINPVRNMPIYYLWKNEQSTRIDPYWGRYAVLKALGLDILMYDRQQSILAVPIGATLPRLLERVLTLCSGYVAKTTDKLKLETIKTSKFKLFRDIPPQIAELTAAKLGQSLLRQSVNI